MSKKGLLPLAALVWLFIWGAAFGMEEDKRASTILHEDGVWGRNPFLTRAEIESLQKKEVEPEQEPSKPVSKPIISKAWEVKSIMITDSSRVAIINNHIVTVGDFVGEVEVLEINEESVIMGIGERKWFVMPRQPSVFIKTGELNE